MLLDPHPEEGPRPPSQRYDVPTFGLDSKRRLKSPAQNEKFYRRLQGREIRERGKINPLIKYDRSIGFAAWGFMALAGTYVVLFADFGTNEHCFSSLRRRYVRVKSSIFNLSPSERTMMGLDKPPLLVNNGQPS